MTTRDEFEKWAFQHELLLNESCVHQGLSVLPKRSTTGKYISPLVDMAWDAWQGRQQEINEFKAEIEKLKAVTILPALPRPQVPRVDADLDLMDIRTLVRWCERIAVNYAKASIEHDRATHTLPSPTKDSNLTGEARIDERKFHLQTKP